MLHTQLHFLICFVLPKMLAPNVEQYSNVFLLGSIEFLFLGEEGVDMLLDLIQ